MPKTLDHPNEPGKWTLLERGEALALWRRERSDPVPVTMFYVLAPPCQTQVVYEEMEARRLLAALSPANSPG